LVVRGATVLMRILTECNASTLPATSIAKKSRTCCPSNRMKGAEYATRAPPSIRYWMPATPLGASVALKETVTFDRYHPLSPSSPVRVSVVAGGVPAIMTVVDWGDPPRPPPLVVGEFEEWILSP